MSPAKTHRKESHPKESQNNPWFGVSMIMIGIVVGFLAASVTGSGPIGVPNVPSIPSAPSAAAGDVRKIDAATDHIRGNPNAKIAVIEYSDFECPFCQRVHPTYKQIMEEYGDDVMWVYRHFPLSFHPNAQKAAEASECAAELGGNDAFWEMADMLFEKGSDNSQLENYAREIGLNAASFKTCLDSGKYAQKTADDQASGTAAGVTGTPGNIVYNTETEEAKLVSGAQPFASFKAAIDDLMQ